MLRELYLQCQEVQYLWQIVEKDADALCVEKGKSSENARKLCTFPKTYGMI